MIFLHEATHIFGISEAVKFKAMQTGLKKDMSSSSSQEL